MRIDHHNHIWVGRKKGEGSLDETMSVEALLRAMDAGGVDMAGVCTLAQDMQNDYILEAQRRYPDRIFGYCMVNPWMRDTVEMLRRHLGEGLKGLKLHPRLHGYSLDDHKLVDPLLQVCAELNVPVFGHGAGAEEYNTPYHFEEIARTFPNVPIILGHMGSYNAIDAALKVAKRTPNLYLDTSFVSVGTVRRAVRIVGADRVLMSTNWPKSDFRIEKLKLELAIESDMEARRKVAGESYARMARMSPA